MDSFDFKQDGFVPGAIFPLLSPARSRGHRNRHIPRLHMGGTAPRHTLPTINADPGFHAVSCRECGVYFRSHISSKELLCSRCLTDFVNDFYAPAELICQKCHIHTTKTGRFICEDCFDHEVAIVADKPMDMEGEEESLAGTEDEDSDFDSNPGPMMGTH